MNNSLTCFVEERLNTIKKEQGDNPFVSIETLTPEDANYLLNHMHKNRKPRRVNLKKIKRSLEEKGWTYPSFLSISTEGELLDGQHRMICLKEATDISASFVIAWNAPPEAMYHIDTGASRSVTDVFEILNYSNAKYINILIRSVLIGNNLSLSKHDIARAKLSRKEFNYNTGNLSCDIPIQHLEIFYLKHKEVFDMVIDTFKATSQRRKTFPVLAIGGFIRALKGNYCTIGAINEFLNIYFNLEKGYESTQNQPFVLGKMFESIKEKQSKEIAIVRYKMLEKSFSYFLDNRELNYKQMYPSVLSTQHELFPVPEFDFKEE